MDDNNIVAKDASATKVNTEKLSPLDEYATKISLEDREVFRDTEDGVQFRNVSWQSATIIFLKIQFAMSILAVPGALAVLGAVGGALSIVGWQALNTCMSPMWKSKNIELIDI